MTKKPKSIRGLTQLVWLPANSAYVFMFGDQMLRLEGDSMFYTNRVDAVDAAIRHGLKVKQSGEVVSEGPNPFDKR